MLGQAAAITAPEGRDGTLVATTAPAAELAAAHAGIADVVTGLLAQADWFKKAVAASDHEVCRGLCRIAVGVGEGAAATIAAGDQPYTTPLINMLLECSQHEDLNVAAMAVEFWPRWVLRSLCRMQCAG